MIPREVLERLAPRPCPTSRIEPVPIDRERKLYLVQAGSVEVAYSGFRRGRPVGVRYRLGKLGRGRLVLSVPRDHDEKLRIFLMPSRDAVLAEIDWPAWQEEWRRNSAPLAEDLTAWVYPFASALSAGAAPKLPRRVTEPGPLHLSPGESVTAGRDLLWWGHVTEGEVIQNGHDGAVSRPGTPPVAVGMGLWLQAADGAAALEFTRMSRLDLDDLTRGIRRLTDAVMAALYRRHREETTQNRVRLRTRREQEHLSRRRALQKLGDVFTEDDLRQVHEDALFGAARAVGDELGIEVLASAASEDLEHVKDPLEAIARASRIRTRPVTLYGDWYQRDAGPLIAYHDDGSRRPVALLRRYRHYVAYDPAEGTSARVDAELAGRLSPHATMLYPSLPERPLGLGDLFRFSMRRRRLELFWILVTGVIATVLGMVIPQATGVAVDVAIPDGHADLLRDLGLGILAAAFAQVVFSLTQAVLLTRVGVISSSVTQSALWDRLLRMRPSFFRGYSSGDLQSRVMAATEISRDLNGVVLSSLFSSFLALLNIGLLAYYSLPLTLLALAIAAAAVLLTGSLGVAVRRHARALIDWEGRLFGTVVQLIQGVTKLRVSGAEHRAYEVWASRYAHELRLRARMQSVEDWLGVVNQVLPTASTALLFWFSYELLEKGAGGSGLSLGRFLAFQAAFATFLSGMISVSNTVVRVLDTVAKGRRLQPILEGTPEVDSSKTDPGRLRGSLELDHVHFRYRPDGPKVLDDVSIHADPGDFIALVGPSGCGKSTILRLLLGFEKQEAGSVHYDGQELSGLDVVAVRRQLGVVLQSGHLSAGSIFRNIGAGHDVTLDEAWDAAEAAGIADEIKAMPMGMHTVLQQGGGSISGGQRQRLLIARALVLKPRVLLFDEATSALDNRTQAIVSERLDRLKVTRVVIAHRLSTIRGADRIYVMDRGRVVQQGRFEDLIEQEGLFARMAARQRA